MVLRSLIAAFKRLFSVEEAHAHCDIPCGIYDPHLAQIAALSVIRMVQLIEQLPNTSDAANQHLLSRYTAVKEEHAELVKKEVRIIWGDYFKPEHLEKYPDLHKTVWNIMKLGSKARQEINMQASQDLLAEVQRFAEAFWDSKGAATRRQPSLQTVGGELVIPSPA
ncbi:MAG TPA: superoxide dismutase, Ni [Dehalococcoidia bacterium]|nr:superoxide dismutase, Ni [Dehalococcoidia bacterium]